MNKKQTTCTVIALALMASACATTRDSVLLGAGIGAGAGSVVGHGAGQTTESTLIGAGAGAVVGGLIGYLSHKEKEKKAGLVSTSNPTGKPDLPFLTKPEVRSIWVPDKIEGNQYIQGHYIFLIEKQSNWSQK
jgi:hypothetical protein